jgi:hypothetical protein
LRPQPATTLAAKSRATPAKNLLPFIEVIRPALKSARRL